jgi:hypothetical protein
MVARGRRIVAAPALACGSMLVVALASPAVAVDGAGTRTEITQSCVVGYRFEPGPIVNGHNRQPTRAEFEARMRELQALSQTGAGPCSAPPRGSDTAER